MLRSVLLGSGLDVDGNKAVVVSGREHTVVTTDDLAQVVLARAGEALSLSSQG